MEHVQNFSLFVRPKAKKEEKANYENKNVHQKNKKTEGKKKVYSATQLKKNNRIISDSFY